MRHATNTHPSEDRLLDLALCLLESDEADATLDHLRVCPDCESRFKAMCRESEVLRMRPRPSLAPPAVAEETAPGGATTRSAGFPARRRAAWAGIAAAAAILALVAFGSVGRREADPLAYWLPVESERVAARSGAAAGFDEPFSEAIDAYRRRDTRRVVSLLEGRPIPNEHEPVKLMLASALVRQRRPAEAVALLVALDIDTLPLPARDRARWILVAAHREAGDTGSAESVLRDLAAGPGEFSDRARRLLDAAK